jgi:stage II sporulation protein M
MDPGASAQALHYFTPPPFARLTKTKINMISCDSALPRFDAGRLRPFVIASVSLFCGAALAGGFAIIYFPQLASQLQDLLKEFAQMFSGLPRLQLAIAIFFNNSLKTLIVILLGPLLGIAPVVFLIMNGAILGAVLPVAAASKGLWSSLMTILPHGIVELPAILLGTSIGLRLGVHACRRWTGSADRSLLSELRDGMRIYFAVIVPLLLLAAAVEVYITPLVAG